MQDNMCAYQGANEVMAGMDTTPCIATGANGAANVPANNDTNSTCNVRAGSDQAQTQPLLQVHVCSKATTDAVPAASALSYASSSVDSPTPSLTSSTNSTQPQTSKDTDTSYDNISKGNSNSNKCKKPGNGTNVDQVMAKSKRAATLLWMLLHAQKCPVPIENAFKDGTSANASISASEISTHSTRQQGLCPFRGCRETKILLSHIKNCPAYNTGTIGTIACPTSHQGCQDSRKLLTHYRLCREKAKMQRKSSRLSVTGINTKQVKGKQLKQQYQQQQANLCLICTLLAKHDKEVTEQMNIRKQKYQHQYHQQNQEQRHHQTQQQTQHCQQASSMSSLMSISTPQSMSLSRNTPMLSPPSSSIASNYGHSKTVQFDLNPNSCPSNPRSRSRTSSIGSITSLLRGSSKLKNKKSIHSRPRATSLDGGSRSLDTLAAVAYSLNDPTLEYELRSNKPKFISSSTFDHPEFRDGGTNFSSALNSHNNHVNNDATGLPFRKRSVSCSIVYDTTFNETAQQQPCETIMEE